MTSTYPATTTTTDYDHIKAILEPFRQIFMTVLEDIQHECVINFAADQTTTPAIITLHPTGEQMTEQGREAFSPQIPYELQTAILKLNQCDTSMLGFLEWIREALRPTGATVEWLLTDSIRPLYILRYSDDDEPSPQTVRHSVFSITTASREQYIADFTLEQFGYSAELWFLEKTEYALRCTEVSTGWRIASEQDIEEDLEIAESDQQYGVTRINAVCEEINWPMYRKLPAGERLPWVIARAREIMVRFEAEDPSDAPALEATQSKGEDS